ncbi:MAG: acyl-CoA dehydratase activase [Syntrophobacteraceae bacterium]
MNLMSTEYLLGLDLGSISLNCVVLDASDRIIFKRYVRTEGRPLQAVLSVLHEMVSELGAVVFSGGIVTGSGKELIANPTGMDTVNEIVAHATAAWTMYPEVKSIIEIGGQDSKYISVGRRADGTHFLHDHAFNELCAAGTGAFIDQQAERLGLETAQFSEMAYGAANGAHLAGRCSVFAKSDMIHLQQKAVPVDEIAAGLCYALARNYLATLCRGCPPLSPILFQGGVAANRGVVRAFRNILQVDDRELIVPDMFNIMGAFGAALLARQSSPGSKLTVAGLIEVLSRLVICDMEGSDLEPLEAKPLKPPRARSETVRADGKQLVMGIDIGSVSTKAVIVDLSHNLIAAEYISTCGSPIEALKNVLDGLRSRVTGDVVLSHVVSTGSGRHLAQALIGGGSVVDEISAQAASAAFFCPDADTVIEIGGQDSKYIGISRGMVEKFRMNRACAAGTGAFLEEQSGRLGMSIINEFSDAAFRSAAPSRLGSRCTVFMDTDLVHHMQRGTLRDDLCAGLAYSIASNYLEKVVGSNTVGPKVVFQGGVAKNAAVHAAFEKLLDAEVMIHPHPEISGALGAAFIALDETVEGVERHALTLGDLQFDAVSESFGCRNCENLCEIRKITVADRRPAYFGSVCGRYEGAGFKPAPVDDAFAVREKLLFDCVKSTAGAPDRGELGIPMTLTMIDYLPFWGTFFGNLGYAVRLSDTTNRAIVEAGLTHVPAEFCHPIKVLFGHVLSLVNKGEKRIFIPHLRMLTPPGESIPRYACPYTQAAPYVVQKNISPETEIVTYEYPVDGETGHWVKVVSKGLGIAETEVRKAYECAIEAQNMFHLRCREEGEKLLETLRVTKKRGAVLIGRPYNTMDRHVNLNLARRLRDQGLEPIPYDFLPPDRTPMPPLWVRIRWGYGRKLVQAARVVRQRPNLGAVIVTNFGCGPDAFVDQYLEYELKGVPHVLIELDDHQAEAGLVTRIEAFARNFSIRSVLPPAITGIDPGEPRRPVKEYTYYVPSFMDHAYAITGALKASGCKTVLLPPTDEHSWNLGLKHAYGRECHPFISFTGDLLKAAERPDFNPREACYFGPSYFGPCLLPQYPLALHLILERLGLADVTVMNITDASNMKELGSAYLIRMAVGLYAIDRMYKWKTEVEPYEAEKGEVDRVYRQILIDLEEGLAEGRFFRTLKKSVTRFKSTPLAADAGARPRIGIVGDIYTRVNEHSNNHLYKRLNQLGFEVWTSGSVIDVSLLAMEQRHSELFRQGSSAAGFAATALIPMLKIARLLIDRYFPRSIRTPQERQFPAIRRASSKYVSFWIDKVLSLNLNRIEEFHKAGADGVINVMCHNCMLGTVTASLSKSIRGDLDDIPLCSLVYGGLKSTRNLNRLEAFAHQVHTFKNTRRSRNDR